MAVHDLDVGGQPAQAQAQHAGRQVRHPSVGEDEEAGAVADQVQAPELLLLRPPDPAVARGRPDAPGCQPPGASQVPPCSATWRRPLPTMPWKPR